jgi:DNA-binding response OmpR family regulator
MIPHSILLVEDEPNDVLFFQRATKKAGINDRVQVARDGQEAIDYLNGAGKFADRAAFPLPDLILLDLKLPFVMGLDVLKWIRQESELAPVVVILSASREAADITAAYRLGANGYLVKPAEASKLDDMVRAINDFWLTQNTPSPNSPAEPGLEPLANLGGQRRSLPTNSPARLLSARSRDDL